MRRNLRRDLRVLTCFARQLPDFIIPGEAKCGTTSLYNYLVQHPDVIPADVKEPRNFLAFGASPFMARVHYPMLFRRWAAGLRGRTLLCGEATAEYFSKDRLPAVIAQVVPGARIIVLLRNPVARALSDYGMFRRNDLVAEPFDLLANQFIQWMGDPALAPLIAAASQAEHNPVRFFHRGLYLGPLQLWKSHFPSLLALRSEDLFQDPGEVTKQVCRYLGLPEWAPARPKTYRKAATTPGVSRDTIRRLRDFFRPHNEELYGFIGRDLGWEEDTLNLEERLFSPGAGSRPEVEGS